MIRSEEQQGDRGGLLHVADVVGTHGLRGDLKVRPLSGDPFILLSVDEIILEPPTGAPFVATVSRQVPHKGVVLLRFSGFDTIDQVEPLVGSKVKLPAVALPELEKDEYYWENLSGLRVVDRHYGELGHLISIFTTAAHDTYVVEGAYGEVMIPAVKEFVITIDLERRLIEVDLPAGLVPEQE